MNSKDFIYHYTTMDALKGILESKRLRFSSCRNYKNSKAEAESLINVISKNLENVDFKNSLENFVKNEQNIKCVDNRQLIRKIYNIRANSYMVCFSKKYDHDVLWSQCAENGSGVVLGFATNYIIPITRGVTMSDQEGRLPEVRWVENMEYGEDSFVKSVIAWNQPGDTLVFLLDAYKDISFQGEEECRLVAYLRDFNQPELSRFHIDQENQNGKKIVRHFHFNAALELDLVSNFKLDCFDNSMAIKKIFCKNDCIFQLVRELLSYYLFGNEITLCKLKPNID